MRFIFETKINKSAATKNTGDFNFCEDGELLTLPGFICDKPNCGCSRSFTGVSSRKSTTCAVIKESGMSRKDILDRIVQSTKDSGFSVNINNITEIVDYIISVCNRHEEEQILETKEGTIFRR